MDLQAWKAAAGDRLRRLARRVDQLAPGALYGALSAATLLPVVTAANQGDFAALVALGGVVGGVGGNLIAAQIQAWHDRSQAELAAELGEKAAADPAWREALDALLCEFEAPRTVRDELGQAEQERFVTALRAELATLGNLSRYEATLSGPGAVVQGVGAIGAGAGGVAARTIHGPVTVTSRFETPAVGPDPASRTVNLLQQVSRARHRFQSVGRAATTESVRVSGKDQAQDMRYKCPSRVAVKLE